MILAIPWIINKMSLIIIFIVAEENSCYVAQPSLRFEILLSSASNIQWL